MELFLKDTRFVTDLDEFSEILTKAVSGTSIKNKSSDRIEKWGSVTPKIKHSYGRDLSYRKIKFWVGLSISSTSKINDFVIQFKPGTNSAAIKKTINKKMPKEDFCRFKKCKDIKIIQEFILKTLDEI